jgi:Lrp/AsnC family leucine-responsive transcriptional regulator
LPRDREAFRRYGLQMSRPLDGTDWRIVSALQEDGRLSFNQLGRKVNLSAPAVAERVRRLEESGVIAGYQARIDAGRAGLPLTAFVKLRCSPGRCLLRTTASDEFPEVVEVHKLSGSSCTLLRVRAASMPHLEEIFERIGRHGEIDTQIVLSTQYEGRPVAEPPAHTRTASPSPGWSREARPED